MPGLWKFPANTPAFNIGTMLLLTDASVLMQDSGTRHWWKLTPGATGDYVNGTWSKVKTSRNAPRYFASAVLSDGQVIVAGGEDNNGQPADLCAAELYDPVSDNWTDLPTPGGWTAIGDAPCCVLPDGTLLLGSIADNRCALFNPKTRTWAATGNKLNPNSNEETWTLLRDGTVLSADCSGHPGSQRYVDGAWIADNNTDPDLVEAASNEIGPAILLPDGRVFAIGATGGTSLFTSNADRTQRGSWLAGPTFPQANGQPQGAKDAPACLLPNGRVLCCAAPVDGMRDTYAGPTTFFEYDPATNTLTQLPSQPLNADRPPYMARLLLLPNGSVLFADGTPALRIYEPDGAPVSDGQPYVSEWPPEIAAGMTGRLEGTKFNGLSQACAYGDDASMATNYPIVRLRASAADGRVFYCRSFNHSTMAVATGAAVTSTSFAVPVDLAAGVYQLAVIANGIASSERAITVLNLDRKAGWPQTSEERDLQHELFWRDLNEVHLLMDFVSGRTDKSLSDLNNVPDPDAPANTLDSTTVVERVCAIRFPPVGDATSRAKQAALLLTVKDRLNALAGPARGLSVAYTAMFSGVALKPRPRRGLWRSLRRKFRDFAADSLGLASPDQAETETRRLQDSYAFATAAYPNLKDQAHSFRYWFGWLPWLAATWALLTALVYWDVALSDGALTRVKALLSQEDALVQPGHPFIPSDSRCRSLIEMSAQPKPPAEAPGRPAPPADDLATCDHFNALQNLLQAARHDLMALSDRHLWRHPVGWVMHCFDASDGRQPGEAHAPREQFVAVVVGVFTNYIVPMMFGLLGTLAGVVRSTWTKVRDSTLRPQDARLAVATVPLGLVAGLAIGLIVSPSAAPSEGISSLAGSITLSATALAFLAGYGAEAFFTMIDELLKRVFALGDSTSRT